MSVAIHLDRRWSAGGSSSNSTILEWDSDGHVTAQINTSNAGVCAAGWEVSQVVFNLMLVVLVVVSGMPAACAVGVSGHTQHKVTIGRVADMLVPDT